MHLPDGFVNNQISLGFIALASIFLITSFIKLRKFLMEKALVVKNQLALAGGPSSDSRVREKSVLTKSGREKIQLMALIGSLIFALQMINFPVVSGTSGHLIGGVLAAVVLGPWAGLIVLSSVLAVQSLVFSDGGLLALGANIFNMGVVTCWGGYYFYRFCLNRISRFKQRKNLIKESKFLRFLVIGFTAWLFVAVASFFCALEIGLSGSIDLSLVIPAMVKVHLLIGLGEAALTILFIYWFKLKLYES